MSQSETTCLEPVAGVPEGLAREILDQTGVAVRFYRPDGTGPVDAAPEDDARADVGAPASETVRRLVREAAETRADRLDAGPGVLAGAWPVWLRARPLFIVGAEVAVSGPGQHAMARGLLAAVAATVRARVQEADVRAERDSLSEALSQCFEEISLLHGVGEALRVTQPVRGLLEYVCSELCETTGAEAAAACLPGHDGAPPETVVAGSLPMLASDLPQLFGKLLDGLDADEGVLINNHCQQDPLLGRFSLALERVVVVPLTMGKGARGAMAAFNREGEEFGSPDVKLIRSSANATAVIIENRHLYHALREMMLSLVRALVSSVDAKDPYTCGHSERVAFTCREIARQMALDDDQAEEAYMAGLLHDIGKIGTPEAILRKEGLLQPEERLIMSQHPTVGGRILEGIAKLGTVREAVIHHHERLDGSGYPDGLRGDAIPPLARIVGLADAFDAMTSNRPYRPMLPLSHVIDEIRRNDGVQFDPAVVEAFFRINLKRLMQQFVEQSPSLCAP